MSALRQARDVRGAEDRNRGRGRGSKVDYYEDMGMSSTEQGHEKFVEYKAKQETAIASERQRLDKAKGLVSQEQSALAQTAGQLKTYKGQIETQQQKINTAKAAADPRNLSKLTNDAWNRFKSSKDMVKVNVVSGSDNRVEGSYYIPVAQAKQVAGGVQFSNFSKDTGQWYFHTKSNGRTIGQELHDGLRGASQKAETTVKQKAQREIASMMANSQGAIAKAQGEINTAQGKYNTAKGQYIQRQGGVERAQASLKDQMSNLTNFQAQEKKFLVDIADKYDGQIDRMAQVLGNVEVKDGDANGQGNVYEQLGVGNTLTQEVIDGENVPVPLEGEQNA